MFRTLSSLVPNAVDLLALEVEELAGVLLIHLKSYEGVHGNSVFQNGLIGEKNFIDAQEQRGYGQKPEYGDRQPQVNAALMEAWSWLEREGFLIRDPRQRALVRDFQTQTARRVARRLRCIPEGKPSS